MNKQYLFILKHTSLFKNRKIFNALSSALDGIDSAKTQNDLLKVINEYPDDVPKKFNNFIVGAILLTGLFTPAFITGLIAGTILVLRLWFVSYVNLRLHQMDALLDNDIIENDIKGRENLIASKRADIFKEYSTDGYTVTLISQLKGRWSRGERPIDFKIEVIQYTERADKRLNNRRRYTLIVNLKEMGVYPPDFTMMEHSNRTKAIFKYDDEKIIENPFGSIELDRKFRVASRSEADFVKYFKAGIALELASLNELLRNAMIEVSDGYLCIGLDDPSFLRPERKYDLSSDKESLLKEIRSHGSLPKLEAVMEMVNAMVKYGDKNFNRYKADDIAFKSEDIAINEKEFNLDKTEDPADNVFEDLEETDIDKNSESTAIPDEDFEILSNEEFERLMNEDFERLMNEGYDKLNDNKSKS